MLLLARIVTSFNHGAFFGVGAVVAAGVVAVKIPIRPISRVRRGVRAKASVIRGAPTSTPTA
jgi:DHA1 family inner membrane transport protein